jgi:hypothetical protein
MYTAAARPKKRGEWVTRHTAERTNFYLALIAQCQKQGVLSKRTGTSNIDLIRQKYYLTLVIRNQSVHELHYNNRLISMTEELIIKLESSHNLSCISALTPSSHKIIRIPLVYIERVGKSCVLTSAGLTAGMVKSQSIIEPLLSEC